MVKTKIQKVGNSLAVIIPREYARAAGIERGDEVGIEVYEEGAYPGFYIFKTNVIT